jgi:hypothetical protein
MITKKSNAQVVNALQGYSFRPASSFGTRSTACAWWSQHTCQLLNNSMEEATLADALKRGNPVVFFDIQVAGSDVGRIRMELFKSVCPKVRCGIVKCAPNFLSLASLVFNMMFNGAPSSSLWFVLLLLLWLVQTDCGELSVSLGELGTADAGLLLTPLPLQAAVYW